MSKLKQIRISRDLVPKIMTEGYSMQRCECTEGLPPGSVLVNAYIEAGSSEMCLVFTNPIFDDLLAGAAPPFIIPQYSFKD